MSGRPPARCSSRRVHFWCAWVAAVPLLLTAVTGCLYRVLRSCGFEKAAVRWLLEVHTLKYVGLRWLYPVLLASALAVMILTGVTMTVLWAWGRALLASWRQRWRQRRHRSGGSGASRSLNRAVEMYERQQQSKKLINATASTPGGGALTAAEHELNDEQQQQQLEQPSVPIGVGTAEEESEWSEVESDYTASGIGLQGFGSGGGATSVFNRHVAPQLVPRWTLAQRVRACLPARFSWRWAHRALSTLAFVPLLITAVTGALWVFCTDWLYWEKHEYAALMYLHEGRYLEKSGTLYVSLLGPITATLTVAGMLILYQRGCAGMASSGGSNAHFSTSPSSLAYARVRTSATSATGNGSGGGFASELSPPNAETRKTLARIHQVFDIDAHATAAGQQSGLSDQSEDEFGILSSGSPQRL